MTPIIKICGITRAADATHAAACGATAIGFVFWRDSPRYVTPEAAMEIARTLPHGVSRVGVFVNESVSRMQRIADMVGLSVLQLHGDERPADVSALGRVVWRATSVEHAAETLADWPAEVILLDAHDPMLRGGTGRLVDWNSAAVLASRRRVVLAGGLTPDNVQQAIAAVRPAGVDVSSGVEQSPGVKDFTKMRQFVAQARAGFNDH